MKIFFNRPCPPEEQRALGATNYCSFQRLVREAGQLLCGLTEDEKIDSIVIRETGIEFNICKKIDD